MLPCSRTSSHSAKASVTGESATSEMAGEKNPALPHQGAASGDQEQPSPVPKPRTRTLVKKPPTLDTPPEAQGEVVAAAAKGEKEATQQPLKTPPPPPSRPHTSTLDAKQASGSKMKMEDSMSRVDAPTPTSDVVRTTDSSTQTENEPTQATQKQQQGGKSETPVRAPRKPSPPSRTRPPPPVRQATQGPIVEASPATASGIATKSVATSEDTPDINALYSVPHKPAKKADPAVAVEELKNTQTNVAMEKAPGEEGPKVENVLKTSSPKKPAPPKPAPPGRPKAPAPATPLVKTKQEVPTVKEEGDAALERKAAGPQAEVSVTATPAEQEADLGKSKVEQSPASEGSIDQPSKSAPEAPVKETPKKPPPKPKPPTPSRPRLPTLEKKQAGSVRDSSSGKETGQLDATEQQVEKREAEDKSGDAAVKMDKTSASAETSDVEIVQVTPSVPVPITLGDGEAAKVVDSSQGTPDIDALYSVPHKPAKKAESTVAVEELKNTQPDVSTVEMAPGQQGSKVDDSPKASSVKRKAPPKPAPPKAPTTATPMAKTVVDTKQELTTVKEEGNASSEKKATDVQAEMSVTAAPTEQGADLSKDKENESPASGGSVDQPRKSAAEAPVKETPKKQPPKPKPPPPSRPRLQTLEKKQAGSVRTGDNSNGKETGQLDAAEQQVEKREAEDKSGDAAVKMDKTSTSVETSDVEIVKVTPSEAAKVADTSQGTPDLDALYSVPHKPAKKAESTVAVEELKNTQPDVSTVEMAPGQQGSKVDDSPKASSVKRKAPPKPAPPKAPTTATPMAKTVVDTKQELTTVKEEGNASSEKKATDVQAEMSVTAAPTEQGADLSKDKENESPASGGSVDQPRKSAAEAPAKEPLKKPPPKPKPPPSRPRLPTLEKKQAGNVETGDASSAKETSQLDAAEQHVGDRVGGKSGDAARNVDDGGTSAETTATGATKGESATSEAPRPDASEDKDVKTTASEGMVGQSGKLEETSNSSPKKVPPKPPPPSRPRLPTLEKKQEAVRTEESSISSKDAAVPQNGEKKAENTTRGATLEEKESASPGTSTVDPAKTDVSSVLSVVAPVDGSGKGGQEQESSSVEGGIASPAEEMRDPPKGGEAVGKEGGPEMVSASKESSPKTKAPTKPAPPTRSKTPTLTSPLMKAFVEVKQDVSTVNEEGDGGSETKTAEQSSEVNKPTTGTQQGEVEVTNRTDEQQPEVSRMSLSGGDEQDGTQSPAEVAPDTEAKKKPPPKPGPPGKPKRPAPARPPMKVLKVSEPKKSGPTSDGSDPTRDGSSSVTSPHSQQEALPTGNAASPPPAKKPENSQMSAPNPAAGPPSKKSPPPKPGPPNKPKPPAPAKVEVAPAERQQKEPSPDARSSDSITAPQEDTISAPVQSASGVDREVATGSEAAESTKAEEVEASSLSTPHTAEGEETGQGNNEAGEVRRKAIFLPPKAKRQPC